MPNHSSNNKTPLPLHNDRLCFSAAHYRRWFRSSHPHICSGVSSHLRSSLVGRLGAEAAAGPQPDPLPGESLGVGQGPGGIPQPQADRAGERAHTQQLCPWSVSPPGRWVSSFLEPLGWEPLGLVSFRINSGSLAPWSEG